MINLIGKNTTTIALAILLFSGWSESYAQNKHNFSHLGVNDGLSQSTIFSIFQDSLGFMWFGTRGGGLNKYDGYQFHVYRNQPGKKGSLSDNSIGSILEDSRGVLWVGTHDGRVNRFNYKTGEFKSYSLQFSADLLQDQTAAVRDIYEDHSGRIWIGANQGVYYYNRREDLFEPALEDAPFPVKSVTSICEDKEGYIYLAAWDRLIRHHPDKGGYEQLIYPEVQFRDQGRKNALLMDSKNRLWLGSHGGLRMVDISEGLTFTNELIDRIEWPASFNNIRVIKEASDGLLWFGTENGLYAYSADDNILTEYRTVANNPNSLGHNSIHSIFEDRVGTLWVGTWSGLSILDKRKNNFNHYSQFYNDPKSLSSNIVSSFVEDSKGTWIGTEQGGLNFLNRDRTEFTAYKHIKGNKESLPSDNVKTIFKDSNNDLWIGLYYGGSLYLGDGRFKNFLEGHSIYSIAELPDGKLLIGGRSGLHSLDRDSWETSRDVFAPSAGIRHLESFVSVLYKDSKNRVWIGTRNEGIYLYDPMRFILKRFQTSKTDTSTVSDDYVISICEDPQQKILIGTRNGLNRFNEDDQSFERISNRIGIDGNIINGLQPDDAGRIWISTNNGLYRHDISSNELLHFDYLDGLQSNEFNRRTCYKNSAGELFFGGVNGFNVFHPDQINKNRDVPPVVLTDLKLFNKSVIPGQKGSPLEKHISETEKIVLTHQQSSFRFDFIALNFLIPEKNSYSYRLDGYEENWNYSGRENTASYMNLDPGKYTFHVRGSNNDGVWNETGTSIDIEVLAPFWATPFAFLLYMVVLTLLLFGLIKIVSYRTEKESELTLERAEKARIKSLNANRLQYFTNISHELRTPLTLIAGPLDKLISGKYAHQSEYLLQLMKSNVNRMLKLINQLMDFRKLENNKLPLKVQSENMDKFLSKIVLSFEDIASTKMIELRYNTNSGLSDGSQQWFDQGVLDKVVYNLLSNAFKFTSEQGIIEVTLALSGKMARIEVSDTGKGIEQSKLIKIFDRFYSDSPELYSSTGIGLSLSKRLIDLHKGTLEVESEKGKGAKFIVSLPITKESYSPEEIFTGEDGYVFHRPELDSVPNFMPFQEAYNQSVNNKQLVLIVEDDPEMSSFLANHLSGYELLLADNGKSAFDMAKEQIPDIIVSDIMMPEMNGIEFCKAVKKEFLTSHIPVILLTAKASIDEKIEGIETAGADAYIEKPFDADYLSVMIRNLLTQRRKLKEKFSGLTADDLFKTETKDEDELFLQKINQVVMENIADLSFSVDQLLGVMGMSRSQLYRKFKAISDKNPSEYIRILRLQHACKLLKTNRQSISEIAYMSGFGNVSYFNTCFKRHFGVSPGKFLSSEVT